MKNRRKKTAVLTVLAAGMLFGTCFISYASSEKWITNRLENDRQVLSAAGQCLRGGLIEGEFYVVGKNYTPEGTVLETFYGDKLEYSSTTERIYEENGDRYQEVRFAVTWKTEPEEEPGDSGAGTPSSGEQQDKCYWQLGDTTVRTLGGKSYTFRCIDQNYQSRRDARETAALFLCDCVIPADTGCGYRYEKQEDGSYSYVFHPGPIVEFGDTGEYKYSMIRQWLKSEEGSLRDEVWVNTGVDESYMGQTENGTFSQFRDDVFRAYPMGDQQMTDRWFILSLDEALKYRKYLWRFGIMPGEADENPESQTGPFSKGYWLRTPMGDGSSEDSNHVYVVDLVNGTIRPQAGKSGRNEEMGTYVSSIGIRPAFALPQGEH